MKSRCPRPLDDGGVALRSYPIRWGTGSQPVQHGLQTRAVQPTETGSYTDFSYRLPNGCSSSIGFCSAARAEAHGSLATNRQSSSDTRIRPILQRVSCLHPVRPRQSMGGLATVCENVAGTTPNVNDACRLPGLIATRWHRPSTCVTGASRKRWQKLTRWHGQAAACPCKPLSRANKFAHATRIGTHPYITTYRMGRSNTSRRQVSHTSKRSRRYV